MNLLEFLRRAAAIALLFVGVFLFFQTGPRLLIVQKIDFQKSFTDWPYLKSKDESLEVFVRKRTEGRIVASDDDSLWQPLADEIASNRQSMAVQIIETSGGQLSFVFRLDDVPPLPDTDSAGVSYLKVPVSNTWISLQTAFPQEIDGLEADLIHPRRWLGLALALSAIAAYCFVPRREEEPHSLRYARGPAVVAPDLLGLAGAAFFFALPMPILAENAPGQPLLSPTGGWLYLTLSLWLLSALCLVNVGIGFFYATLRLRITETGLAVCRWSGVREYAWSQMTNCLPYESKRGRVLGGLLVLFANSPGMIGQGLLLASNEASGLTIAMRNGKPLSVMANSLPGFPRLVAALQERSIPGADALAFRL